jgi:hypothetical protein
VMMTDMMVKMSESLLPKIQVELEKIIADEARHLDEGISAASTPKRVSKPRKRARH